MKIIQYDSIQNKIKKTISTKNIAGHPVSNVFELENEKILKIFDPNFLKTIKRLNYNMENKIRLSEKINFTEEIVLPESIVYHNGLFIGYITSEIKGIDYNAKDDSMTNLERSNLYIYATEQEKIENILRNNKNIVFPDFCTCDNIIIDPNGNFRIIDFDGMQVGKEASIVASTSLGNINKSKYKINDYLYTKNVDKRSSIILYFLSAFNLDLTKVGYKHPLLKKEITLFYLFEELRLDDPEMYDAVARIYSDEAEDFLGELPFKIAEKYNMRTTKIEEHNIFKKVLQKKSNISYY